MRAKDNNEREKNTERERVERQRGGVCGCACGGVHHPPPKAFICYVELHARLKNQYGQRRPTFFVSALDETKTINVSVSQRAAADPTPFQLAGRLQRKQLIR